ncbi:MAG: hypothetical protein LBC53_03085 [Spirochaetaceae bacterium]|jgi:hypothetical protein|nr:hypothetical protein [Spirochaetaceae bacterium]
MEDFNNRCFSRFENKNAVVLGFDTGLSAASFARMRQTSLLDKKGFIVDANGGDFVIKEWKPESVAEVNRRMVVYGVNVEGEPLAASLNRYIKSDADKEAKADFKRRLRLWFNARIFAEEKPDVFASKQEGLVPASILTGGKTVFFAPLELVKAAFSDDGAAFLKDAERYVHPELIGKRAVLFTAGALLYTLYSKKPPFPCEEGSSSVHIHTLIRSGVFTPLEYEAPGIDVRASEKIGAMLRGEETENPPDYVWEAGFSSLSPEEIETRAKQKERFVKKQYRIFKRRLFFSVNKPAVKMSAAAAVIMLIFAGMIINGRLSSPTTRGLEPLEVAKVYYEAFSSLNVPLMEACLQRGAGAGDVNAAAHLYVVNKTRESHGDDVKAPFQIKDADFVLHNAGTADEAVIKANYTMIFPQEAGETWAAEGAPGVNEGPSEDRAAMTQRADTLYLSRKKDLWHITKIEREEKEFFSD